MVIDGQKFKYPAFLVGNGINLYKEVSYDWTRLLNQLYEHHNISLEINKNDNTVTYPEILDMLMMILADNHSEEKTFKLYSMLKRDACEFLVNKQETDKAENEGENQYQKLVNFAAKNNIPIMTTNFDLNLVTEIIKLKKGSNKDEKIAKLPHPFHLNGKPQSNGTYLWFDFFADKDPDESFDAKTSFAIWPIHGTCSYPFGIKLGASDYAKLISNVESKFLKGEKNCESKSTKKYEDWYGRNSFLDIFFNNDLIIFGLGLKAQESFIRWLLIQRSKHLKNTKKARKTIYYYSDDKDMFVDGDVKKPNMNWHFFDALEIEVKKATYDKLYGSYEIKGWPHKMSVNNSVAQYEHPLANLKIRPVRGNQG